MNAHKQQVMISARHSKRADLYENALKEIKSLLEESGNTEFVKKIGEIEENIHLEMNPHLKGKI